LSRNPNLPKHARSLIKRLSVEEKTVLVQKRKIITKRISNLQELTKRGRKRKV